MSMAISNTLSEKSINFGSSVISNKSKWSIINGDVTLGDNIILGAGASCKLELKYSTSDNLKCTYIKLLTHVTCDDTTLSTDDYHLVDCSCLIKFTDSNENSDQSIFNYFPKYDFEDTYKNDYTIFAVNSDYITSIELTLQNKEDIPVIIKSTGLYFCKIIDDEYVKQSIEENASNVIQDALENNTMDLVIPLINDISEMNNKPDGAICRCSWIEGAY